MDGTHTDAGQPSSSHAATAAFTVAAGHPLDFTHSVYPPRHEHSSCGVRARTRMHCEKSAPQDARVVASHVWGAAKPALHCGAHNPAPQVNGFDAMRDSHASAVCTCAALHPASWQAATTAFTVAAGQLADEMHWS